MRQGGQQETKCLWCDWGHLHRENPLCVHIPYITAFLQDHTQTHTHTERKRDRNRRKGRTQRSSHETEKDEYFETLTAKKSAHFCLLLTQLGEIQPSAAVFTDQTLHNIAPYPSSSIHDSRKGQKGLLIAMIMFLELRKQTLPDPRRDARTC